MEAGGAPQTPDTSGASAFGTGARTAPHASVLDAMGLDKRRKIVGGRYRPTRTRQLAVFGTVFAIIAVLFLGGRFIAEKMDEPPKQNPPLAPWAAPDSPQRPVERPL